MTTIHQEGTTMNAKKKFLAVLVILGFVSALFGLSTNSAVADTTNGTVTAPKIVTSGSTSSIDAVETAYSTAATHSGTKIILEDVNTAPAATNTHQCMWTVNGYNSGHTKAGKLYWFKDPKRAQICRNSHSPTGWVKVAGGISGRNCHNPYAPPKAKVPGPIVTQYVLVQKIPDSASTVQATLTMVREASVTASCTVTDSSGDTASASAEAFAFGTAYATASASAHAATQVTATHNASLEAQKSVISQSADTATAAFVQATVQLVVKAFATCTKVPVNQVTCTAGNTTDQNGYTCTKDGSTTPQPTSNPSPGGTSTPPGPNPSPSPGSPSSKCYSQSTGQPVASNPDGTCPPGSIGS